MRLENWLQVHRQELVIWRIQLSILNASFPKLLVGLLCLFLRRLTLNIVKLLHMRGLLIKS